MPITVVSGPPCAGKSTWAREHAAPGEVVVDLDLISEALGAGGRTIARSPAVATAQAARRAAIGHVLERGLDAIVIDTSPGPRALERYRKAGAELVELDPGMGTCLERCRDDGRPEGTEREIRKWYARKRGDGGAREGPESHTHAAGGNRGDTLPAADKAGPETPERAGETGGSMPNGEGGFTPITSQEQLDEVLRDRLARKEKSVRGEYADYDDLKKRLAEYEARDGQGRSELEQMREQVSKLRGDIEERDRKAALEATRAKVAKATKLPADVVASLSGTDEETLMAQAEPLARMLKPKAGARVPKPGTFSNDGGDPAEEAKRSFAAELFGASKE